MPLNRKILPVEEVPLSSTARTINNLSFDSGQLPRVKRLLEEETELNLRSDEQTPPQSNGHGSVGSIEKIKKIFMFFEPKGCLKEREDYSLYLFPQNNRFDFFYSF